MFTLAQLEQAIRDSWSLDTAEADDNWTPENPSLGQCDPTCPNYKPKQSDLVVTGGAESDFSTAGLDFDSEVQVFQTAQMVRLDWQRSLTPTFLPCLRSQFPSSASAKLVSLKRIPFPKVATYTAAFRLVTEIVVADLPKERVTVDVVVAGSGRTEIALTTTTTTSANRRGVNAAEVRLARILASRFPA